MRDFHKVGPYADIVEAPSPTDSTRTVKLGVRTETFRRYGQRSWATPIAQYYGIVQDDLISAQHLFRGLKRPLLFGSDPRADQAVLVYTWRSLVDFEWEGSPQFGQPKMMTPPPRRVFVVIVREEGANDYDVFGSIERWNWVREDPELPQAPVAWEQRYDQRLWSNA